MADIRIDLSVPVLAFGVGPFKFDPVATFLGCSFEDIVESLLVAPSFRRRTGTGAELDVFPLALPDGEGAGLPLGRLGEASFQNRGGELVLHTPRGLRSMLLPRVQHLLVRPARVVRSDSGESLEVALRLRPGLAFRLPLGSLGELGIECL